MTVEQDAGPVKPCPSEWGVAAEDGTWMAFLRCPVCGANEGCKALAGDAAPGAGEAADER